MLLTEKSMLLYHQLLSFDMNEICSSLYVSKIVSSCRQYTGNYSVLDPDILGLFKNHLTDEVGQ